jgi:DNA helicase HerA-like ATPase
MELGVGEALVSCLDEKGQPQIVERAFIIPPRSQLGPISPQQRQQIMANSIVAGVYDKVVDRESAYEKLTQAVKQAPPEATQEQAGGGFWGSIFGGNNSSTPAPRTSRGRQPDSMNTIATKSIVRSVGSAIGSAIGRQVIRGVLGSIFGGGRKR